MNPESSWTQNPQQSRCHLMTALCASLVTVLLATPAFSQGTAGSPAPGGGELPTAEAEADAEPNIDRAIEAASDELWHSFATADARTKAMGLAARAGADRSPEPVAKLSDDIPKSARVEWASFVAGELVDVAVQQGRFKVKNETTIPGGDLMIISYAVLWVLLLGFTGLLAVRERRLASDLESLERELAELGDS